MDSPYSVQRVRRRENKGGKGSKEEKKSSPFLHQSHDTHAHGSTPPQNREAVQEGAIRSPLQITGLQGMFLVNSTMISNQFNLERFAGPTHGRSAVP